MPYPEARKLLKTTGLGRKFKIRAGEVTVKGSYYPKIKQPCPKMDRKITVLQRIETQMIC